MTLPKLSRLELRVMQMLWSKGPASIRELVETFPEKARPAYTTIQTVVNRLEEKKAIRRVERIGNAHIFEAVISQQSAVHRMIDELVAWFGGKPLPIMTHLIESGKLTPEEIRKARKALQKLSKKDVNR